MTSFFYFFFSSEYRKKTIFRFVKKMYENFQCGIEKNLIFVINLIKLISSKEKKKIGSIFKLQKKRPKTSSSFVHCMHVHILRIIVNRCEMCLIQYTNIYIYSFYTHSSILFSSYIFHSLARFSFISVYILLLCIN